MKNSESKRFLESASHCIPGGVNSPVRAYKTVGGTPPVMVRAQGPEMLDIDGNPYIDLVCSYGAIVLGHSHPIINEAIESSIQHGTSYCTPHALELDYAEMICQLIPSIDMVRMVNSGTEAAMTAIRLARGVTGRDKIIKFAGGYHGHEDSMLVNAGSGSATLGTPSSPGVPAGVANETLVADYNDLSQVEALVKKHRDDIAAIIVEPIAGNMGMVPAIDGFLDGLRDITHDIGALLIFDEVITGFRVHRYSAQTLYQITPDLTVLGKIIGGGLPVGALGGKREFMEQLAPAGPVYQAGTLAGNPVVLAAGYAALNALASSDIHEILDDKTRYLTDGIAKQAEAYGIPLTTYQQGGMFGWFLSAGPITNLSHVAQCDHKAFTSLFHHLLSQGIHMAPSPYEAGFVTTAHDTPHLDRIIDAFSTGFAMLAKERGSTYKRSKESEA